MVTVASTAIAQTYLTGKSLTASFSNSTTGYLPATDLTLTNVPNGSKVYYSLHVDKTTAGTADVRIQNTTDATTIFEQTGITTAGSHELDISGTLVTSGGSTSTIEVQIKSSDANASSLLNLTTGTSWICITDADKPIAITSGVQSMTIPGKRNIGTLKVFYGGYDSGQTTTVGVNGIGVSVNSTALENNSNDMDVMTNEINVDFSIVPVWTDTFGQAAVIIGYDGFNVEVTG